MKKLALTLALLSCSVALAAHESDTVSEMKRQREGLNALRVPTVVLENLLHKREFLTANTVEEGMFVTTLFSLRQTYDLALDDTKVVRSFKVKGGAIGRVITVQRDRARVDFWIEFPGEECRDLQLNGCIYQFSMWNGERATSLKALTEAEFYRCTGYTQQQVNEILID